MRNALYPGYFNDMLVRQARTDLFTRIWRIPPKTPDEIESPPADLLKNALFRSMADCELVLRFFAIKETIEQNLKGGIKGLLDACMKRHADDDETAVRRYDALFERCLRSLDGLFNAHPFVLPETGRTSRSLYDALMVAYSLRDEPDLTRQKVAIQGRIAQALEDQVSYEVLVGRGNTVDAIKARVRKADFILTGEGQ